MSDRYLCIRNFSDGFGERISEWERNLTAYIHNFRVEGGSLCDLYGVEQTTVPAEPPLSVHPSSRADELLYVTEFGVYAYNFFERNTVKTLLPYRKAPRAAVGEFRGKCVGFAGAEGVYLYPESGTEICLSSLPAEDICYRNGRWYFVTEGSLQMTKPYSAEMEEEGELAAGTVGEIKRCFVSEGKVVLLARRAVYVLSGETPKDFTLTVVPLLRAAIPESAAADSGGLYFLTKRAVMHYAGDKMQAYELPGGEEADLSAGGAAVGGEYRFFFQGKAQKKEGAFDTVEKTVFLGSGRGITSLTVFEDTFYAVYADKVGKLVDRAVVDGVPLYKCWRSRPTDFGRLSGRKVLKGAGVFAETAGKMVLSSESGAVVIPLGAGNNERRILLGGARFTVELSSSAPGARFVKPVIIFSE